MTLKSLFASALCSLCITAQAHDRWLLPSHFNLSSEGGEWITVDSTASNETFTFDKPMGIDSLVVVGPDGTIVETTDPNRRKRKSVADIQLQKEGTYRLQMAGNGWLGTTYELNGEEEWLEDVSKKDRKTKLPQNAKNVISHLGYSNILTYVTLNAPSKNVDLKKQGLEYIPVTHPSDIVGGEEATFQLLFNGQPVEGIKVSVVREGMRYRNDPEVVELATDAQGKVRFIPAQPGRYLLTSEHTADVNDHPLADQIHGSLFLTFEAILD